MAASGLRDESTLSPTLVAANTTDDKIGQYAVGQNLVVVYWFIASKYIASLVKVLTTINQLHTLSTMLGYVAIFLYVIFHYEEWQELKVLLDSESMAWFSM